ncbi:hypothetical protein [Methylicorpusculum sp.]|uniref:hypothetical protein n=1 Tax=Methylicorpusculum sp. TaxID=2713644 RepID=UPI00273008EA|nr:hypothetical protein [Methylicorpusculum sp.]MDP2179198.1 hypothetical protein [Methylicorpusculum sp.]MDP3527938.1 hypothetical protein [Methylicorpusculum sp.]
MLTVTDHEVSADRLHGLNALGLGIGTEQTPTVNVIILRFKPIGRALPQDEAADIK